MFNPFDEVTISEIELEKLQYHVAHAIPAQTRVTAEKIAESLVYRLSAYIQSEKAREESHTFEAPATWWDHFKRDVLPSWLRRRLAPVRLDKQIVTFKGWFGYPELKPSIPDQPFVYLATRTIGESRR